MKHKKKIKFKILELWLKYIELKELIRKYIDNANKIFFGFNS